MRLTIAGPTYNQPSLDFNAQRTINWYPVHDLAGKQNTFGLLQTSNTNEAGPGSAARTGWALYTTPGTIPLINLGGQQVRALWTMGNSPNINQLIAIVDGSVYSITVNPVNNSATSTLIGTIPSNNGNLPRLISNSITIPQPSTVDQPQQLFIADGPNAYVITMATNTLTQVPLAAAGFNGCSDVCYLDGYFIGVVPNSNQMFATAAENGLSLNALNFTTANATSEYIVGIATNLREMWVFGNKIIEVWYNSAQDSGFPFSRRTDIQIDKGCGARNSICMMDNKLFWLDNYGQVCSHQFYRPLVISTDVINRQIQAMSRFDDAVAYVREQDGHWYYVISFPTGDKTFVYDIYTEQWHEHLWWNTGDNLHHRHLGQVYCYNQNKHIVGSWNSGQLYVMDVNTYTDAGNYIKRVRTTQHIANGFNPLTINRIVAKIETGVGLANGQGSNPLLYLEYSKDGGHTFSQPRGRSIFGPSSNQGPSNIYGKPIRWTSIGTAKVHTLKFTCIDPVPFRIMDISADVNGFDQQGMD